MELKYDTEQSVIDGISGLLIAPYGIEIDDHNQDDGEAFWLLIAPYGIEIRTRFNRSKAILLLIAPYGIEIAASTFTTLQTILY